MPRQKSGNPPPAKKCPSCGWPLRVVSVDRTGNVKRRCTNPFHWLHVRLNKKYKQYGTRNFKATRGKGKVAGRTAGQPRNARGRWTKRNGK